MLSTPSATNEGGYGFVFPPFASLLCGGGGVGVGVGWGAALGAGGCVSVSERGGGRL